MVFTCVQAYCLVYSITMYCVKGDCSYPTNSVGWGTFIWWLTRFTQYLVWVYPIMYIFWPRSLQQVIIKKCNCCFSQEREASERRQVGNNESVSEESKS